MTRPVYEPSLTRTDATLGFGSDQLFRRPAPLSSSAVPVYRAEQYNNITTVVNNSWNNVSFDEWSNPDSSIFDEVFDGGGDVIGVQGLVRGLYLISFSWQWSASWTGATQGAKVDDNINYWQADTVLMPREILSGEDYTMSISRVYDPLEYSEGHIGTYLPDFRFFLAQNKGVNKDAQGRMTISYWPALIGDPSS